MLTVHDDVHHLNRDVAAFFKADIAWSILFPAIYGLLSSMSISLIKMNKSHKNMLDKIDPCMVVELQKQIFPGAKGSTYLSSLFSLL